MRIGLYKYMLIKVNTWEKHHPEQDWPQLISEAKQGQGLVRKNVLMYIIPRLAQLVEHKTL